MEKVISLYKKTNEIFEIKQTSRALKYEIVSVIDSYLSKFF